MSSKRHPCLFCFLCLRFVTLALPLEQTPPAHDGRFSIVLSGLVHFKIPNSTLEPSLSEAWIQGGRNGLIIAADIPPLSQYGHFAEFPSDAATVLMQVPTVNGGIPDHDILHAGPCGWEEMIGL
jgi:hypothetical protein